MTEKRGKRGLRTRGGKPFFSLFILKSFHRRNPLCFTRPQAAFAAVHCEPRSAYPLNLIPHGRMLGRLPR